MSESIITRKRFELAVLGVDFYKQIVSENKEYVMTKQFLCSITSFGANVREVVNGQSKAGFIHKLSIAQKECDESMSWLEILKATNYILNIELDSIYPTNQ